MARKGTHPVEAITAAGHLVAHLAAAREIGDPGTIPRAFREVDFDTVRLWPAWVVRAAVLKSRGTWWLWCEPRARTRPGAGQIVINLPAGRYLLDVMDARTHAWFSRESAAGPLLVAGLASRGGPVIARIRRVTASQLPPAGDDE